MIVRGERVGARTFLSATLGRRHGERSGDSCFGLKVSRGCGGEVGKGRGWFDGVSVVLPVCGYVGRGRDWGRREWQGDDSRGRGGDEGYRSGLAALGGLRIRGRCVQSGWEGGWKE